MYKYYLAYVSQEIDSSAKKEERILIMKIMVIKLAGEKNGCKTAYLHKLSSHKMLFNYKGKSRNVTLGKPVQQNRNQVIKVNTPPAARWIGLAHCVIRCTEKDGHGVASRTYLSPKAPPQSNHE